MGGIDVGDILLSLQQEQVSPLHVAFHISFHTHSHSMHIVHSIPLQTQFHEPHISISIPPFHSILHCSIPFHTTPFQLKTLLSTVQYFDRYKLNQKYLRYKPSVALSEDRKGWWRYAITAVLEEDVKRRTRMWSWKHMKQHRYHMSHACDVHVIYM